MSKLKQLTVEVSQLIDNHNITKPEFRNWAYFCMRKEFPSRFHFKKEEEVDELSHGLQLVNAKVCKFIDTNCTTKIMFCRWVFPFIRQKFPPKLLPTPLKIVHKRGQKLYIKDGFDGTDKNPIYGIQFPDGLILSIQPYRRDWQGARDKAMSLRLKKQNGRLPSAEEFAKQTNGYEKEFIDTLRIIEPDVNIRSYCRYTIWTATPTPVEERSHYGRYSTDKVYYHLFCSDDERYGFSKFDWLARDTHIQTVIF